MEKEPKFGVLSSSVDPQKLALTVKGVLVALAPTILLVAKLKGWEIGEGDINNFIDGTVTAIGAFGTLLGYGMTLYGLMRKVLVYFKK